MITMSQLNERLMVSVTDKVLQQEKVVDHQLLQLALVDIASGPNSLYKLSNRDDPFFGEVCFQNGLIQFILQSQVSFRTIQAIIKMSSPNFLKPYQLQTVMSYAETQYHSNDYQFLTVMGDVLSVVKA
jgi:hypothetical protein